MFFRNLEPPMGSHRLPDQALPERRLHGVWGDPDGGGHDATTAVTTPVATAPVAVFRGYPTWGTAPLTVSFSSASTGTLSSFA